MHIYMYVCMYAAKFTTPSQEEQEEHNILTLHIFIRGYVFESKKLHIFDFFKKILEIFNLAPVLFTVMMYK